LKTQILLGIIAVTIFGTMAVQGMMVQAGISPIEIIQETGVQSSFQSIATCPATHPFLIGGSYDLRAEEIQGIGNIEEVQTNFNTATNSYEVTATTAVNWSTYLVTAKALCASFNFPMNMGMAVGGELINIDTVSLLVSAIGVNPVITAIVGITLAGVAGQIAWFVYKERKKKVES